MHGGTSTAPSAGASALVEKKMPKVPSTDSIPEDTKSRMDGTKIEILETNILKTTESEHKNLENNWEKADTTALLGLIIKALTMNECEE